MKSMLTRIIALVLVCSLFTAPVSAQVTTPTSPNRPIVDKSTLSPVERVDKANLLSLEASETFSAVEEPKSANEPARYVVILPDEPLATYKGGLEGLEATSPAVAGGKVHPESKESQAYLSYLEGKQNEFLQIAGDILRRAPEVLFRYRYGTNGFSMILTPAEAETLAAQTGARVLLAPIETPDTDEGPSMIGAPAIWAGETAGEVATKGEGILVGIIDTGINFDHPSFSDEPADGYTYNWTGDYLGVCDPGDGDPDYATACNDKVVGAFTYVANEPVETVSPEDSEGHGSHTASTVAGNTVEVEFQGVTTTISGVAPHAQIIAFDVCVPEEPNGACYGDATVMAVDDAIANGVDVINYSISGGADPYNDPVELAFLSATEAGIFVSTSAGNAGDTTGESSVAHRSPWVSTVAAATHARIFANELDITGPGTVPPELVGLGAYQSGTLITSDLVNLPIKYSPTNISGCAAFPAGFFTDSLALVQRGTCTFAVKEANARAAGATYVFIFNSRQGPPVGMSGVVSASMLSLEDGMAIKSWIDANSTATATFHATTSRIVNPLWQDIVADFSSFGPNTTFDVLKPDITGPGVNILAAVADGTISPSPSYELDLYQGTSMSSPHNAGAAALMMALHPDWTPMEIRSAMMMTAHDGLLADRSTWGEGVRPATAQDEGAGRIALADSALVGLVLDETIANFEAADPALGGDPATLNLASLYSTTCVGECSWTRTVRSVLPISADFSVTAPEWVEVTPAAFTLAAGATQELTITADVSAFESDVWQYGKIIIETDAIHPGPFTSLLQESFETWPLTGWTIGSGDESFGEWQSGIAGAEPNQTGGSGDFADANADFSGGAMDTWMISPEIELPAGNLSFLTFRSDFNDYNNFDDGYVDVTTDGGLSWTNVLHYEKADFRGPRLETIDLTDFAGQTVQIRFHYVAPDWDWYWQVDDVNVQTALLDGGLVADAHIPLAVLPTASNLPELVKYPSHRDAASETISDLQAVEITEGSVYQAGLSKAELETFTLDPDPTPGDPMDDLSQVFVKKLDIPAYTIRLVGEITASTSQDLDMFLYWDADGDGELSGADYLVDQSATSAVLEYINAPKDWVYYDEDDTYFLLVQNWAGAEDDSVTLAVGMVPDTFSDENYMVTVPATNPAGAPFSIDVTWNVDSDPGDRLYGYFETYAYDGLDGFLGGTDIDIQRLEDDVVKTADVSSALPGDVITYTIAVNNFSTEDVTYTLEDPLPEGVTYVAGSATGGATFDEATNSIVWEGLIPAGHYGYVMSTSAGNPACAMPLANSGAYANLQSYGLPSNSGVSGEATWAWTAPGDPITYYNQNVGNVIRFTDDGYAYLEDFSAKPSTNTDIPDPALPNNLLSILWRDMAVVYDAATNKGVTLANLTSGGIPNGHIIEYDDVAVKGQPTQTYDMEVFINKAVDDAAGQFEVVLAYDNILGPKDIGTIGIENATGTEGLKFAYNDAALATLTNGMAICFNWEYIPTDPKLITFQVTVDETHPGGDLTNQVQHSNDQPGTMPEFAQAVVTIEPFKLIYLPVIFR